MGEVHSDQLTLMIIFMFMILVLSSSDYQKHTKGFQIVGEVRCKNNEKGGREKQYAQVELLMH